jgi:hypothetical protein
MNIGFSRLLTVAATKAMAKSKFQRNRLPATINSLQNLSSIN